MAQTRAWLPWFVLVSAIWGSSFLWIKIAVEFLAPFQVAFGRVTLGALTLVAVALVRGIRFSRRRVVWAHSAGLAVTQSVIPFSLFAYGETHISSVLAGIWNAATPLWTVAVAFAMLPGERPDRNKVAGATIGFIGVMIVLGVWQGVSGNLLGSAACLVATLCYAISLAWTRRWVAPLGEPPETLVASQLLCASLMLGILCVTFTGLPSGVPLKAWAAISVLGIVCTGAALLIHFRILMTIGAVGASAVTYVTPIFSTLLGIVILSESISWNEPVGAAVILLGVALVQGFVRLPSRLPSGT